MPSTTDSNLEIGRRANDEARADFATWLMMSKLNSVDALPAEAQTFFAGYLLDNYNAGTPALGTGISAMPSMHVAIATLNALMLSSLGRWQAVAGWAFAAIILFGSVYTGWHYAIDGYVSMLVVGVIWQKTRFLAAQEA